MSYATSTVVVFATPTAADATVAFLDGDGAALPDDEPAADGHAVSLAVGANTIRAQVSAHDGTTETYTVTVTRKAPELESLHLVSDPDVTGADDDTYQIGDTIEVRAVFDVAVTVSGTPELELNVGGEARTAAYASGSGSTGLTFAYDRGRGRRGRGRGGHRRRQAGGGWRRHHRRRRHPRGVGPRGEERQ